MQVFLSHSSRDKTSIVEPIANKLGAKAIYDAYTFESGMKTFNEIKKHLKKTDLFVIFLSSAALDSPWVKSELSLIKEDIDLNLKQIYPIVIDPSITHLDERIPDWLKKYNLRYINKQQKILDLIKQRMREIRWDSNPLSQKKDLVYKGRYEQTSKVEERFNDVDLPVPRAIFAQGFTNIGRRTFLVATIKKLLSKYSDSYRPPQIILDENQSIEDFILLILDLGYSSQVLERSKLFMMDKPSKIQFAVDLLIELNRMKDLLLIEDNGSIIRHDGFFVDWFIELIQYLKEKNDDLYLIVASRFILHRKNYKVDDYVLNVSIPELSPSERLGLFKDYVEIFSMHDKVGRSDYHAIKNILSGYPDQVRYLATAVYEKSMHEVLANSRDIVEYNNQQVYSIVQQYEKDTKSFDFLLLLSNIDLISFSLLESLITKERDSYYELIEKFFIEGICVRFGTDNEYFRVNDVVRDYIKRLQYSLPKTFKENIVNSLDHYLKDKNFDESDITEYFYFLKQGLAAGKQIEDRFLLPSHFLRTIAQLYNSQKYDNVIEIAKRILKQEEFMDSSLVYEIRHYYCSSLARQRDNSFLDEVQKINVPAESFFLKGFYYRLLGKYKTSLEMFDQAMAIKHNFSRAKREKLQVYLNVYEYDVALNLAKENYAHWKDNLYHIHAYFTILLQNIMSDSDVGMLKLLLKKLHDSKDISDKAKEMSLECEALFISHCLNDKQKALETINQLITEYPKTIYPLLAKFDIFEKHSDIEGMKEVLAEIIEKDKKTTNPIIHTSIVVRKIAYLTNIKQDGEAKLELDDLINKTGYSFTYIRTKYHL